MPMAVVPTKPLHFARLAAFLGRLEPQSPALLPSRRLVLCRTVPQHRVGAIGAGAMEENRVKGRASVRLAKTRSHATDAKDTAKS